jgi:hypothetical protein
VPLPRPAPGKAKGWALATIGILMGCAFAVWWGIASTAGHPTWDVLTYRVLNDRNVDVTYVVSRPAGRNVTCAIAALDRSFATVGLVQVQVQASDGSDGSSVRRTTRVRTTARAVTGLVKSCAVD